MLYFDSENELTFYNLEAWSESSINIEFLAGLLSITTEMKCHLLSIFQSTLWYIVNIVFLMSKADTRILTLYVSIFNKTEIDR